MRLPLLGLLGLFLLLAAPRPARAAGEDEPQTAVEVVRSARSYFNYGDYKNTIKQLTRIDVTSFESAELRVDAYKLLGLAWFFQGNEGESYKAFLELLNLEPDFELDTFVYPPAAVNYFERVKREAERQLAPIRAQKHQEEEARMRVLREEAARRKQREQEEEQRRLAAMAPVVERRIVQREFWVSVLPFGLGQLQNGDRSLGIALATSQVIAGATSAGSALLIEQLRDPNGKFDGNNYALANRLSATKWIGAVLFYSLWVGGAVHAAFNYKPESAGGDRLVTQQQQAAAPAPPATTPAPAAATPAPVSVPPAPLPAPALPPNLTPHLSPARPATAPAQPPVSAPAQPPR